MFHDDQRGQPKISTKKKSENSQLQQPEDYASELRSAKGNKKTTAKPTFTIKGQRKHKKKKQMKKKKKKAKEKKKMAPPCRGRCPFVNARSKTTMV